MIIMTSRSPMVIFLACALTAAALQSAASQGDPSAVELQDGAESRASASARGPMIMPNGVSVPGDFPHIEVTRRDQPADGYLFLNNWRDIHPFNIIFDDRGYPVWYLRTADYDRRRDFKIQKNGVITMLSRVGPYHFLGFDQDFNPVSEYTAVDGYSTDEHELHVLEDGSYYLVANRGITVDMSQYVPGGQKNASVSESIIQGFSPSHRKVFQWNPWDHFDIRDLVIDDPTAGTIRFPHMNAIDIDDDDQLLLSSRHLSEVTKINRQTGAIIWRLGGAHNQFTFINDPLNGFTGQHDIRSLGNGHYTLFDNGNLHDPPVSRAVEYELDPVRKTATLVWEYRNPPGTSTSYYMGNVQRLPNGNTQINWAVGDRPKATEVRPDGSVAYEMNFTEQYHTYRAFRFPWHGKPAKPYLIAELYMNQVVLLCNKFGDSDVDYYRIYGGSGPSPTALIDTSRTTLKRLSGLVNGRRYYFRVTAVSRSGVESGSSNEENVLVNFIPAGQNMVSNGDFSQNNVNWTWTLQGSGDAQGSVQDGVFTFDIANGGVNYYDVQLTQNGMTLIQGQTYRFEFDAWAAQSRAIEAKVGQEGGAYTNYSRIGLTAVSPQKKHFTYSFLMQDPSDANARVVFNCGNSPADVFIDNVSLAQEPASAVEDGDPGKVDGYALAANSPNPFNESTRLEFQLKTAAAVTIELYDCLGRRVQRMERGVLPAGPQKMDLRLPDLSSGVYVCRISALARTGGPPRIIHHKIALIR
jgi:hypothetical protein